MSVLFRRALPLCLALAGCGGGAPAPLRLEIGGLEAVEAALAEQRGQPCLLNFWATWCGPCVAELPDLLAVAEEYEALGVRVLGVSYDLMIPGVEREQTLEKVRTFLAQRGFALPTVIYEAPDFERIDARFELPGGVPVTLAYDRAGKLVDLHQGEGTRERFEEMVQKALAP